MSKASDEDNAQAKLNRFKEDIGQALNNATLRPFSDSDSAAEITALADVLENITDTKNQVTLEASLKSLMDSSDLQADQLKPITEIIEKYHESNPRKQEAVVLGLQKFSEPIQVDSPELNKFKADITDALEKISGNSFPTTNEKNKISDLAYTLEHINDGKALSTLDVSLKSLMDSSGLQADKLKPIIEIIEKYHKDPSKQENVTFALKTFEENKTKSVEIALDTFGSSVSETGKQMDSTSIDEITQAIRDEIIAKQQAYLQGEIAKTLTEEEGIEFKNKTPQEIRAYLGTEEGKEAAKLVMKTKEAQSAMNKIEVDGYKKVHEAHKDSFKNVGWDQETGTKVRIAEIKNDAGEKVASLKETTVDATPTQVTLEDGTTRTVKSYRQIDFPTKLDDGKGPAHFSMALKDENGRNISAKDAVYFTAHYDDDGKLTEVSSPVPVKFMGEGDDAIGYIERNGKVYTLPVTQGKYKEMMKEVAINNGLSVDLGQAVDSVSVGARTTAVNLEAPEGMVEKVKVTSPKPEMLKAEAVTIELTPDQEKNLTAAPKVTVKAGPMQTAEPKLTGVGEISDSTPEGSREGSRIVNLDIKIPQKEASIETGALTPEPKQVVTNQITGGIVSPAVMQKVQNIRHVLDTSLPRAPQAYKEKEALGLLEGKTSDQASKAISTAISKGDDKLVKAMMSVIDKPPEGVKIPELGVVTLKKIYTAQMDSASKLSNHDDRSKIQRAAGAMADKAGITDHRNTKTPTKQPTAQVR